MRAPGSLSYLGVWMHCHAFYGKVSHKRVLV